MLADPGRAARVADLLAQVISSGARSRWSAVLVEQGRTALAVAGLGLTLSDATGPVGIAAATEGLARTGEELQFGLGEGPCREATLTGRVVRVPDLSADGRWVLYAREAAAAGIRAEFCVPLTVGAVRVGVLSAFTDRTGDLAEPAWAALRVHADAATAVLLLQERSAADEHPVGDAADLVDVRPVVHQAAGRVAVQLDVDLTTALLRLRAHAFATGRPLRHVAADVAARRLVFDHTTAGATAHQTPAGRPPVADHDISKDEG